MSIYVPAKVAALMALSMAVGLTGFGPPPIPKAAKTRRREWSDPRANAYKVVDESPPHPADFVHVEAKGSSKGTRRSRKAARR